MNIFVGEKKHLKFSKTKMYCVIHPNTTKKRLVKYKL